MTANEIENILIGLSGLYDDCRSLAYIVRDKKFFQPKIGDLRAFKKQVVELKKKLISDKNEDGANLMLSCECFLDALIAEITMWLQLKNEDPNSAWNSLVTAQQNVLASIHAHKLSEVDQADYFQKLNTIEKMIFPPQSFMSTGMIIENTKCSICKDDYDNCEHISGKAYMGEFCSQVVTKIKEMKEISIVDEPFDKRCRVDKYKEDGHWYDKMTGNIVKDEK